MLVCFRFVLMVFLQRRPTASQSAASPRSALGRPRLKSASPEVPLHFYRASDYSTSSINHRMFYVNLVFLVFCADAAGACLDL